MARVGVITGRPPEYHAAELRPVLRAVWSAANYPCGRRLAGMMADRLAGYEQHEKKVPASGAGAIAGRQPAHSGPALASLASRIAPPKSHPSWKFVAAADSPSGQCPGGEQSGLAGCRYGALCGGSVAGDFVWMVDAVDYATTWVSTRAMWNRGQEGTLAALADLERCLPFPLLGLDSDRKVASAALITLNQALQRLAKLPPRRPPRPSLWP
ncbi:MAG TPA: hypothetical protein VK633_12875 [Verrucomicrobiae bacterium]|nr:hypothetical protein [Verrucomicrobiae bacterium]